MLNGKQIGRIIHQINKNINSNNLTSRTGLRFTISRNKNRIFHRSDVLFF